MDANPDRDKAPARVEPRRELAGEDVVNEVRIARATLLKEAGGDLEAAFDLVEREARELKPSTRRKSA